MYGGPGTGGGSFLPWVSPPQRCPGVRRTPGIIGPGEARGVVITSIRRGVSVARGGNTLYPKIPVPEIGYR